MKTLIYFILLGLLVLSIGPAMRGALGATTGSIEQVYQRPEYEYLAKYKKAMLKGDYEKAEEILKQGIDRFPNFSPFYYNLVIVLTEQGKLQEARDYLHVYLDLEPDAIDDPNIQNEMRRLGLI